MTIANVISPGAGPGHDQPSQTDHADHLRYWRAQLQGAILAELPTDRSQQRVPGAGAIHAFRLPREVSAAILALMNKQDAALLDLTVAAVAIVLARYTGSVDLTVATVAPWRGGGTRILPLRSRVPDAVAFQDFLGSVRDTASAAAAHSGASFESLVAELDLGWDLARACAVVEPSIGNAPDAEPAVGLAVRLDVCDGRLAGAVECHTDRFASETLKLTFRTSRAQYGPPLGGGQVAL